ncbi:MAG: DsbA family protein [Pseudomonadota bacterium]
MTTKLYYVHDPMCSWCWAFRPIYNELTARLPNDIELIRLLGGLAPDSDKPMSQTMRDYIINNWKRIQKEIPATNFNYDFWKNCLPRRSTYPACRAVIAARKQGAEYDELMTYMIQKAYYLESKNPSEHETLIELAKELELNEQQFCNDLGSIETNNELSNELKIARQLGLNSFPGFLYMKDGHYSHIAPDYIDVNSILEDINFEQATISLQ